MTATRSNGRMTAVAVVSLAAVTANGSGDWGRCTPPTGWSIPLRLAVTGKGWSGSFEIAI